VGIACLTNKVGDTMQQLLGHNLWLVTVAPFHAVTLHLAGSRRGVQHSPVGSEGDMQER
jgi:hypothetical protein